MPRYLKYKIVCLSEITTIASLDEFMIRDLNDEINKLLKEKGHWEWQIKELGGNIADVFYFFKSRI